MHFVRLAGCSVGKAGSSTSLEGTFPILKTGREAWLCHTYDGRPFWCDTDFHFKEWWSFDKLLSDTWENHLCLTGGEPLIHMEKLVPFIDESLEKGVTVHIETSGTIDLLQPQPPGLWISVSPKQGCTKNMIMKADEIKLLVDGEFNLQKVPLEIYAHPMVWVQPVNDEFMVRRDNYDRCMEILRQMPRWRLSVQLHKFLNIR
jgi:organic radical activating enzyme